MPEKTTAEKTTAEKIAEELLQQKRAEAQEGEMARKDPSAIQPPVKKIAKIDPKVKSPPLKEKRYYDVKVECMLPATLTFRVLAEDPAQATNLIRGMSPIGVKHKLVGRKDLKMTVYEAGSSLIKWVKNLVGM
jgi:hypothetical protein